MSARVAVRQPAAKSLRDFNRSLPMQLLLAREAVMERFRPMLHAHGVTEQQWRVLRALEHQGTIDLGGLAESCRLLGPSLTRIVRALEKKGLLSRRPDARDQRRMMITITQAGLDLLDRVGPHSEQRYSDLEARFGPARLEELYDLLEELVASLEVDKPTC